jgi:ABC-type uncharacterized transport system ATPase subunit
MDGSLCSSLSMRCRLGCLVGSTLRSGAVVVSSLSLGIRAGGVLSIAGVALWGVALASTLSGWAVGAATVGSGRLAMLDRSAVNWSNASV